MIFHDVSKECFVWLKKQPNVKEESLTDWMLYTVSERTNRFYYKTFTRNEEACNGADWEWWVLTDGYQGLYAYRFLVQAKKLKRDQDQYPLISYGNRNGLQIDLLIQSAKHRNAMPVYMYYSVAAPETAQQIRNFSFIDKAIVTWCEQCTNGIYMSMAQSVKDNIFGAPRRRVSETDLLNDSLGLSMCDLLFSGEYSPEWIMDSINRYYVKHMGGEVSRAHNGIKHFGKTIPNYLDTLLRRDRDQLDWYEAEFKSYFNDLAGIAVVDLRKHP